MNDVCLRIQLPLLVKTGSNWKRRMINKVQNVLLQLIPNRFQSNQNKIEEHELLTPSQSHSQIKHINLSEWLDLSV